MSNIKIKKIEDAYSTLEALRNRTGDKKFLATPYIITSGDIRAPDPLHHIRFNLYSNGPEYKGELELILENTPKNKKLIEDTLVELAKGPEIIQQSPKDLVDTLLREVTQKDSEPKQDSYLDFKRISSMQGLFFYRPKPMQGALADFALIKNPLYFRYSIVLGLQNTKTRTLTTRQEFTQDLRDLFTIAKGVLDKLCKERYDIDISIMV